jgi:ABC-type polar amino acid transport system ATPase subunit
VQLAMQRALHTRGGPAAASRGRPSCFRHNAVCMQHLSPPRTVLIRSAASDRQLALQGLQKLRSRAAQRDTPAPVSGTWQQLLPQVEAD